MSKFVKFFCISFTFLFSYLEAHLCDNVFRQADKLIVKPEIYNIVVKDRAAFKIFLQNNMDRGIAEISLIAESPAFDFQIYPQKMSIPKDQRVFFEVTMIPKPQTSSGNYPVTFRLVGGGRQFKTFSLDVTGTSATQIQDKVQPVPSKNQTTSETPGNKKESALLPVRQIFHSPKIDGRITEECWKNVAVAGNFSVSGQGKSVYQTVGLIAYDTSNMYFAFYCRDNEPEKVSGRDRIEIKVSPDASDRTYYSIILTGDGKISLQKIGSTGTVQALSSGELDYAVYKGVNAWMLEVRVPFSSIGAKFPESGEVWNLKIIRTKSTSYPEESYWALDGSGMHQEKGFGKIVFSR